MILVIFWSKWVDFGPKRPIFKPKIAQNAIFSTKFMKFSSIKLVNSIFYQNESFTSYKSIKIPSKCKGGLWVFFTPYFAKGARFFVFWSWSDEAVQKMILLKEVNNKVLTNRSRHNSLKKSNASDLFKTINKSEEL